MTMTSVNDMTTEELADAYGHALQIADTLRDALKTRMMSGCIDRAEGAEFSATLAKKTFRDGKPFEEQHPDMAHAIKTALAQTAYDEVLSKPMPFSAVPDAFKSEARTVRTDFALTVKARHDRKPLTPSGGENLFLLIGDEQR